MYDHDEESVFSMLTRVEMDPSRAADLRESAQQISQRTGLSIRTWSSSIVGRKPRLAICATYRTETPRAVLAAVASGHIAGEAAVMISNRQTCRGLAEEFGVPWFKIGDAEGRADDDRFIEICDEHEIDYIVLARYMRILPPLECAGNTPVGGSLICTTACCPASTACGPTTMHTPPGC